jgi:tripartite-type tricarboxylate transporter receptor subunit TctC
MRPAIRAFAAVLVSLAPVAALAQGFPAKPVRMIVPFAPGGGIDVIARLLSHKLQEMWGQNVMLEYRPGAGAVVGTDAVAKAPADGYTTGLIITSHVVNPGLRANMPFDTIKDLSGVSMVAVGRLVLTATNSLEANNLAELIAFARKNPGRLTYATPGAGTAMHLAGELFKSVAGVNITHIPYKGTSQAYPDVISGRVALQFDTLHGAQANIKSGKVKAIAITSLQRSPRAPTVPAVAETYEGFNVLTLSGVVVPSATPRDIVKAMSADINKALQSSDLAPRMEQAGMEPSGSTPEQFDTFIRSEIEKWTKVVRDAGIRTE